MLFIIESAKIAIFTIDLPSVFSPFFSLILFCQLFETETVRSSRCLLACFHRKTIFPFLFAL